MKERLRIQLCCIDPTELFICAVHGEATVSDLMNIEEEAGNLDYNSTWATVWCYVDFYPGQFDPYSGSYKSRWELELIPGSEEFVENETERESLNNSAE